MSTKDEIAKLNIELDAVLDECKPADILALSDKLKLATTNTKANLTQINSALKSPQIEGHAEIIKTAENTLGDLRELIHMTKTIANRLYGQLVTIDISDPNLIMAAAEFVRSTRESIADFIQLYRDEQSFLYKTQLSMLEFAQKKELIKYKAELDANKNALDADVESVSYTQEDIINILNN